MTFEKLLEAKEITKYKLSKISNVNKNTIYNIAKINLRLKDAEKISNALDITCTDLYKILEGEESGKEV